MVVHRAAAVLVALSLPAVALAQANGLVAAYSFEETTGTTTADASGQNNTGTISGATRTTAGKVGRALSFDGVNDRVNIPDSNSLDLTTGMTLEAWVYPTTLSGWRTVMMKEVSGGLAYLLYAHDDAPFPAGMVRIGSTSRVVTGNGQLPLNTWTHLATTYDRTALRLYVNGTLVGTQALTGNIATSTLPLRIGGNSIWGEYFAGRIDEARIYNRALSAAEIAADMALGSTPQPPTLSITAPANNATLTGGTVNVTYATSGDLSQANHLRFSLDGAPEQIVAPLSGQFQLTQVAPGPHNLTGYVARADNTKIAGSDSAPIAFTMSAPPLGVPVLTITAPTNGATLPSTGLINVAFNTTGDLTAASHVHLRIDGGPETMAMSLSGAIDLPNPGPGTHTLTGYVASSDHSKINGSDATPVAFTVSAPPPALPVLTITAPTNGATLPPTGSINVAFITTGNLTDANHVHLRIDGGPETMALSLSGAIDLPNPGPGAHVLTGYVARSNDTKIDGSDAVPISFSVSTPGPGPTDPATIGQWSSPITVPTVAVNLVMLQTGKAIFWAGDFSSAPNYGEVWDPTTNAISPAPNPFSNIFCSANVHLADGRVLVAGGHDKQNGNLGNAQVSAFNPLTETWTSLPQMAFRRWYPTLTALGDGRAIVLSGSSAFEDVFVEFPEIYDPISNTWTTLTNARRSVPQYPMVYLLPDGRLLQSGTTEHPTDTVVLDIATQQWTLIDNRVLEGGSGVQYAPGKIMKSGSASNDGATPDALSADTTYVLDMTQPSPQWRTTARMAFPRTFHNLTSLADGSVIATSGSRRKSETNLSPAVLEAELWSPETETWTTLATMQTGRIYHSTAVLMPDGRVAVSGSGNINGGTDQRSIEIFSPPYLFKGPRPVITSAPALAERASSFLVQTPDPAGIRAVNLVRLGAATHNFDQDQRFVPLTFTAVAGGVQVQMPSNTNAVPPGPYMLFLISNAGVPSTAKMVRVPAPSEDLHAPTAPTSLVANGGIGAATLAWQAATDNVAVTRYDIHRSAAPSFTPSSSTLVGQATSTSFTSSGPPGTYHFAVVAVDAAGNTSPPSNIASATTTADTTAPTVTITAPLNGATVLGATTLSATATDDVAVAGVQFRVDGVPVGGEDTVAPYAVSSGALSNGPHVITAVARDAAGNTRISAPVNITGSAQPGLVAIYDFEAGSGTALADGSGNSNDGTISGATWTAAGRVGSALSFDGVNDIVNIPDSNSLDLTAGMTLEAWVYPTALSGWRTVLMKEISGGPSYLLYAHDDAPHPAGLVRIGSTNRTVIGNGQLPLSTWTHLATTYDGSALRLYVNGTLVGTQATTGSIVTSTLPLRIGGNSIWGEYFAGRIDEIRIYNRALSATEIATDMTGAPPPPPAPRLTITSPTNGATVTSTTVNVSFTSSGDLTAAHHAVLRLDGGAPTAAAGLNGTVTLSASTVGAHTVDGYLARADQTAIAGSDSAPVSFTVVVPDAVRPTAVFTTPRDGDTVTGNTTLNVTATDNIGVVGVQFKLNGQPLGAEDTAAPYSLPWSTSTIVNGTHVLTAVARDAAGNQVESLAVNIVVTNATGALPAGLVAAYSFDAGSGTAAADGSGNSNNGTISGATWTTAGRFGSALSFDGVNDRVNIPDSNSLDLTTGMTVEAWVYPTALSGWRTVVMKEVSGGLSYLLYAHDEAPHPAGMVRIGSTNRAATGSGPLTLNTWTHLATTYDGSALRLYVNGTLVGTQAVTGNIATSTLPLRIGGNSIWGEYFAGRIDEIRIFNRALNVTELQSRMNAPLTGSAAPQPTRSTPIVVDATARRVWVVNPDSNTVTVLHADTLVKQLEIPVGRAPTSVALDNANQVWIACRDDDTLWVLNATTGALRQVLTMPWGSAPTSVVFTPDGSSGFVALAGSSHIQRIITPSTFTLGAVLQLPAQPRALAVTADATKLFVSRLRSPDTGGEVFPINIASFTVGTTVTLPLDSTSTDGSVAARGVPNYLTGLAIDPADGFAWVVAKKDNILRGMQRDGSTLTFETTARAMVGRLDLRASQEQLNRRTDLDDLSSPSAVALNYSGSLAFVTVQGNNRVLALNQLGAELVRADTGLAPQGVAVDHVSKRVFTQDLMSRTVSVFDATQLIDNGTAQLPRIAQIVTAANETLSANVLRGKQIFYNAADTRMSRDGYISCASCHLDGEHDARVWDFTDRGEGLRNTTSLRGSAGNALAPLHWTGNFDEVQDFENDIRGFFGGTGFMSDVDFFTDTRSLPLGAPKQGVSADLDALAAYVNSLTDPGFSPFRQPGGALTAGAQAGQALFTSLGCGTCHSGARFSDSASGLRHDVGTRKPSSGNRVGVPIDGFDTPTLLGLWETAPYLHDGSAATLRDVLTTANPAGLHGATNTLTPAQIDQLVEYLNQIEPGTP